MCATTKAISTTPVEAITTFLPIVEPRKVRAVLMCKPRRHCRSGSTLRLDPPPLAVELRRLVRRISDASGAPSIRQGTRHRLGPDPGVELLRREVPRGHGRLPERQPFAVRGECDLGGLLVTDVRRERGH